MSDLARRPTRITVTLAAVAAVVAAVLLLGDTDTDTNTDTDTDTTTETPAAAPRTVSPEEFCASFGRLNVATGDHLSAPTRQSTEDLKAAAAEVRDLADGTDMPDDAKAGVDFITGAVLDLDDVATGEDIAAFDELATLRDSANAKALGIYVADTCVAPVEPTPK